ncbi:MAG: N-acetylmuramidase domain-containing protein [Candidatus Polarisedimenticolaceae bacterium]|nr:N-acetylmuramidase domain-containing protein [Candidatus Polarisedimenticolaceae bacterium]
MLATVSATTLNVRSLPNITGKVLGVLTEGTVIDLRGANNRWAEISFNNTIGFVATSYLETDNPTQQFSGIVTTSILNVRDRPAISGARLGTLHRGSLLNIRSQQNRWLEIEFNDGFGFVSQRYVQLFSPTNHYRAIVTAPLLNIRSAANLTAPIIGQVAEGTSLNIDSTLGDWARLTFNGNQGFAHTAYLKKQADTEEAQPPTDIDSNASPIPQVTPPHTEPLRPIVQLPISGDSRQRKVATTWNNFGGLLEQLCEKNGIEPACAVAVLCVESSGKGFEQNNQNRMIIRFENHKFWKYWGRYNTAAFRDHFGYNANKVWTGHKWRASTTDSWQPFHGNQAKEWQVFEFAKSLNAEGAMRAISMGAPQIMGFHFERIGYQSVDEMFESFSKSIAGQINGLFDFFSESMLNNLRTQNFVAFAKSYNGSGQKEKYGRWIKQHYDVFRQLYR